MENEIMNYDETAIEEVENDNNEVEVKDSGMSTGVAMLIGAGLTIATGGLIKLGKKLVNKYKAKKAEQKTEAEADEDYEVVDE
jgi:hypothetical protein